MKVMEKMQYVVMKTDDIRTNLATEQYLMNSDKIKPPFMLFYIEKPCIIVGRNQNTMEEISQKYCEEHGITITRRLSGGGAMYQDLGNLCFSFVVPAENQKFGDFKSLVQPVVDALHKMGVTGAETTGRNDIVVDGKKFSGNAMYTRGGKTFSQQYEYQLDDEDKKGIEAIEQKLYKNWDWVYGKSPEFTVKRRKHFTSGTIDARFLVEDGKIKDIKIYGDFFGSGDVKDVEDALRGLKYDVSTIKEALGKLDLNKYFVGIDAEDIKELISTQQ